MHTKAPGSEGDLGTTNGEDSAHSSPMRHGMHELMTKLAATTKSKSSGYKILAAARTVVEGMGMGEFMTGGAEADQETAAQTRLATTRRRVM